MDGRCRINDHQMKLVASVGDIAVGSLVQRELFFSAIMRLTEM